MAEYDLQWAAIERLPTFERLRSSLFDNNGDVGGTDNKGKRMIDVTKLGAQERHHFIEKLIKHIEHDNLHLLRKIKNRIDNVGGKLPTVEVRYKNLHVEAECEVVHGKTLPTLWNSLKSVLSVFTKLPGSKSSQTKISIINDVSGIIKPGRITLLLGPPGCGKTTLLKALSGNLNQSLKCKIEDNLNLEYTLMKETMSMKTRGQLLCSEDGYTSGLELPTCSSERRHRPLAWLEELSSRITGEISYNGYKLEEFVPQKTSSYISQNDLHIHEMTVREILDFSARCQGVGSQAEVMVEVSEREKEAGVVPDPDIDTYMKAISVKGLKGTLQTDYILKILALDICADTLVGNAMRRGISGGQKKRLTTGEMIVGPTKALFMDEITNGLDSSTAFQIVTCLQQMAHITDATVLVSLLQPAPETFDLFDDLILMSEGKIVYHGPRDHVLEYFEDWGFRCPERKGIADFVQEVISRKDQAQYWYHMEVPYSYVSADMFSRKFKESPYGKKLDEELSEPYDKSQSHKDALSFSVYSLSKWELFRACASRELLLMKRNSFIYIFKTTQTQMDIDVLHANYYMGALFYSLNILLVDGLPELAMTLQRLEVFYKQKEFCFYPAWAYAIPAIRTHTSAMTAGSLAVFLHFVFGGFIITQSSMPVWLKWGFWVSPLTYGEIGLSLNEFLAPRWQKMLSTNTTIGQEILKSRGLNFDGYLYWISLGALFGFTIVFNIGYILALSFLKCRMVLPFTPLTVAFQDVQYYVDTPLEMRENGFTNKKLQILSDIMGALRPGVLTALMGVSGAGKTTLLDVLAGRKTSGYIEGQIKIGGYPKVQETFARVSGYCEQTDIHSPQITVEESVIFSAWLQLSPQIDAKTKAEFVNEVLETIELDGIKDALVGIPGVTGLSNEQRKRLTIAVELVANPSIIFMDEPTTGLDARAAAIVMRAVKNAADTGRTIVCTIHQPSIDIFEAFDELILLKTGGHLIYSGQLGEHSSSVIEYFESIPRVPKIRNNYNPAAWMLDVTSTSAEAKLGIDFALKYRESALYEKNKELVRQLSSPPPGSRDLYFPTLFSQNGWGQFKSCLWKQHLAYWRSPAYNLMRILFALISALIFGVLYWNQGKKINNQQNVFNIFGAMYSAVIFLGISNCTKVLPYVATERTVMYREKFAGMYSSWAYSLAQVIVEVPYLFIETVIFVMIIYPMIGYYGSAYKVSWYFYVAFCSLLYYNYLGMLLVSFTPNYMVATILSSGFYTTFNLFAGFFIPEPQIPKWWIWLYYLTPTSWSLNGLLTSQYGDINKDIMVFGETKTVVAFLRDYFGFHHDRLPLVAIVLIAFPLVFASLFAYFIARLNFQRR
uniref:ABC transporter domain-containing protein n=1 Tax=Quercus lobata TaxID=97700 RepID=A0A7N2R0V3_QUELO